MPDFNARMVVRGQSLSAPLIFGVLCDAFFPNRSRTTRNIHHTHAKSLPALRETSAPFAMPSDALNFKQVSVLLSKLRLSLMSNTHMARINAFVRFCCSIFGNRHQSSCHLPRCVSDMSGPPPPPPPGGATASAAAAGAPPPPPGVMVHVNEAPPGYGPAGHRPKATASRRFQQAPPGLKPCVL